MKAGRKKDPRAGYVMHRHKNGEYSYAYTSKPCMDNNGKRFYERTQWGRLDSSLLFEPFMAFRCLPPEEKQKFVFPEDWDLSRLEYKGNEFISKEASAKVQESQECTQSASTSPSEETSSHSLPVKVQAGSQELSTGTSNSSLSGGLKDQKPLQPAPCDSKEDLPVEAFLVGASWLVSQWAEKTGLRNDLLEAFHGNEEKVDILMSLVIYCLTHHYTFSHMADTQGYMKYPTKKLMTPSEITDFFQGITLEEMSRFFSIWAKKHEGDTCGFDSTSISSYSQFLCDVKRGYNKDGDDLPQINFVIVYSLTSGVPIYYEEYSGNHPDCRGLLTALHIIWQMGIRDFVLVTDRGYDTLKNIEELAWEGQKVLTAAKTSHADVKALIKECDAVHYFPKGMEWDSCYGLFYKQVRKELVLEKNGEVRTVDYRINLYYSHEKAFAETSRIFDKLKDMESRVRDAMRDREKPDKESFSKSNNLLVIKYTDEGYVESFTRDESKLSEKLLLCGFYASKTLGLDITPMAAHIKYKFRDEHEKEFYVLKDTLNMCRLRSHNEESKNGRVFTLFIALIIASSLRRELRFNPVLGSKLHNETDLLSSMMSLRATYQGDELLEYHPFIGIQNLIVNNLGLQIPEGCGTTYTSIQQRRTGKRGRPKKVREITLES